MVPKLHKKGASFKGAAAYLLHDKGRAKTSERVAWTQTRNLAVDNPDTAWRIMAATALDQNRLKENAGIKATGRKSDKSVLHLSLSWHPDERENLSRQDMKRAAGAALNAIGASEHQALIIAHNDETHPHIHILVNRVNPDDGRMLSSSKEKLNLSAWAEAYERDRGKIFCEERVHNNEARSRGEYVRCAKVLDRRAYEEAMRSKQPANENDNFAELARQQRQKSDAMLAERSRKLAVRQKTEWQVFTDKFKTDGAALKGQVQKRLKRDIEAIRYEHQPSWRELNRRHNAERIAFEQEESSLLGKFRNARDALALSKHIHKDDYHACMADMFGIVTKRDKREQLFLKRQRAEKKALALHQKAIEDKTSARMRRVERYLQQRLRRSFFKNRECLIEAHRQQKERIRDTWRIRKSANSRSQRDFRKSMDLGGEKPENALNEKEARKQRIKQQIKDRLRGTRNKGPGRDGR